MIRGGHIDVAILGVKISLPLYADYVDADWTAVVNRQCRSPKRVISRTL